MTTFVAIAGAKGGVGRTTLAINTASALQSFGRSCIIVDADISKPNVGIQLGIADQEKSLHTALVGHHNISEAIIHHPSGVYVVPAHLDLEMRQHNDRIGLLKEILQDLHGKSEVVLIDTNAGLHDAFDAICEGVDSLIVVTSPDTASVTDALKTIRIAQEKGTHVLGVVVNKVSQSSYEMEVEHIQQSMGAPIIGIIPYDEQVLEAQKHKYPVVYSHQNADATIGFKKLAANLIGVSYQPDVASKESVMSYILRRTGLKD